MQSHAILQDRFAVGRDGYGEARGESGGLFEFEVRIQHRPIAANGFVDDDRDGIGLVVAQRNFVFHFHAVRAQALEIGLFALGDHVEGVADVEV